jgi:hypothetical protein
LVLCEKTLKAIWCGNTERVISLPAEKSRAWSSSSCMAAAPAPEADW